VIAVLILAAAASITGTVRDSTGAVVPGALVVARPTQGPEREAVTGPDGRFTVEAPEATEITLLVRAGGFAETARRVTPSDRANEIAVVVEPANILELITVTPTRSEQRLGDTPASVQVLTHDAIEESPALMADDVLRQIPTFSLFRRTSSLVAQPDRKSVV